MIKDENVLEGQKWVNGRLQDGVLMVEILPGHWEPENRVHVLKKYFESSPIAMIPVGGYTHGQNFSKISIAWLKWVQRQKILQENRADYKIQHGYCVQGEKRIPKERDGLRTRERSYFTVDGFAAADNTILEFYGCR